MNKYKFCYVLVRSWCAISASNNVLTMYQLRTNIKRIYYLNQVFPTFLCHNFVKKTTIKPVRLSDA
jgi:hypothetical protein